jgi:hypothetical protein
MLYPIVFQWHASLVLIVKMNLLKLWDTSDQLGLQLALGRPSVHTAGRAQNLCLHWQYYKGQSALFSQYFVALFLLHQSINQ